MNELQDCLLKMLIQIDIFCRKNDITYYMIGGTMLGAVRHKGFIPWDDDIDIGMPREDYNKFIKNFKIKNYNIETVEQNKKDYVYPFAKIYDENTTLIENTRYKTKRGLYIDIFPLDGIGNNIKEAYENFKVLNRKINIMSANVCALNKNRKLYKNLSIVIMRVLSVFMKSTQYEVKKVNRLAQKFSYNKMRYVGNLVGNWNYKEIMPKEYFGVPTEYEFEGYKFYGAEQYENYLSCLYGDYMRLPPIECQKSHHDFIEVNLNKSYLKKE